jgi:hypothetical protein
MPPLPSRELFESQRFEVSAIPGGMSDLAARMARAIKSDDLNELSRLAKIDPSALFYKDRELADLEDDDRAPVSALRIKHPSFAFDAGLAWAVAAGSRLGDLACSEGFKGYLASALGSGFEKRQNAIAFASGALHAPMAPTGLSTWFLDEGAKIIWGSSNFGAVEITLWGSRLTESAQEHGKMPGWCADVIGQAIRLRLDGSDEESRTLLAFAKTLGPPSPGWMSKALYRIRPELDERQEEVESRLKQWGGYQHSKIKAKALREEWAKLWEDHAVEICANGPPSWSEEPLADKQHGIERLRANVEKCSLAHAAAGVNPPSLPRGPRV